MVVWAWPVNFIPQTACHLLAKITILCDNNQIDRFYWNNLTKVVITLDFVTQNNIGGEYGRLEIKNRGHVVMPTKCDCRYDVVIS